MCRKIQVGPQASKQGMCFSLLSCLVALISRSLMTFGVTLPFNTLCVVNQLKFFDTGSYPGQSFLTNEGLIAFHMEYLTFILLGICLEHSSQGLLLTEFSGYVVHARSSLCTCVLCRRVLAHRHTEPSVSFSLHLCPELAPKPFFHVGPICILIPANLKLYFNSSSLYCFYISPTKIS